MLSETKKVINSRNVRVPFFFCVKIRLQIIIKSFVRPCGRSGCAITILGSTALLSYNPGVIPQRRHAVYTDIAEAHGTQRNETRPTFNGSKISPSNASIRVQRWWRRGEQAVGFIRHSAEYTPACTGACSRR